MIEPLAASALQRALVSILDLSGTCAFALSGAIAGIRRRLDVFGVLVLSFATATSGGVIRDLLIGAVPPAALRDWRYLAVALASGLVAFVWLPFVERFRGPVRLVDAAGLAFFAVAGTQKALEFGLSPVMAALLGMLTGVGGGVIRDVFLAQIPSVLRSDFYAVAALAGSAVVVAGALLHLPLIASAIGGGLICFGLRVLAIRLGWSLPAAHEVLPNTDPGRGPDA